MGFTSHYRAADGGQPAVIIVRKLCINIFLLYAVVIYFKQVSRNFFSPEFDHPLLLHNIISFMQKTIIYNRG